VLHSWHFNRNDTHATHIVLFHLKLHISDLLLWDFIPCKALYGFIFRYKYVTDFVNVGMQLLNIRTDVVELAGLFFRKVAYSSYDALSLKF
jgi:hypothetical protein